MPGLSATEIVAAVHSGRQTPVDTVRTALAQAQAHAALGAIQELFGDEALRSAGDLAGRPDLATLPLAGLPMLIKDNLPVAGHPMRDGSQATSATPAAADHEVVRRLRAAGAIIIGTTRVPELCIWASTDSAFGITRNPWNRQLTPGGSSGGSAAAVAAGIVPVAHGNDGMGSIRIPAANTGLFGIKPGRGVVPADIGPDSWGGMAENGPLATTVADAALVLSVMADQRALGTVVEPASALRIAVASNAPSFLMRLHPAWRHALDATAEALRAAGHHVEYIRFPYPLNPMPLFARWFAGTATDAASLDLNVLEPRTRRHVQLGRLAQRHGWVHARDAESLAVTARQLFAGYDVLLTPMLARNGPHALQWHRRGWLTNIWSNLRYAPYAALWNVVGWPAASIPAGVDARTGMPTAVQAVAAPGGEPLLLGLAAQIERLRPWPRHPPESA